MEYNSVWLNTKNSERRNLNTEDPLESGLFFIPVEIFDNTCDKYIFIFNANANAKVLETRQVEDIVNSSIEEGEHIKSIYHVLKEMVYKDQNNVIFIPLETYKALKKIGFNVKHFASFVKGIQPSVASCQIVFASNKLKDGVGMYARTYFKSN